MQSARNLLTPRRLLFAAIAITAFCVSFAFPAMPVHAQKGGGKGGKASGLIPIVWKDSKSTPAGHLVASPGMGAEPVAVGIVSVGTRNVPVGKGAPAPPNPNSGFLGISLGDDGAIRGAQVLEVQSKS